MAENTYVAEETNIYSLRGHANNLADRTSFSLLFPSACAAATVSAESAASFNVGAYFREYSDGPTWWTQKQYESATVWRGTLTFVPDVTATSGFLKIHALETFDTPTANVVYVYGMTEETLAATGDCFAGYDTAVPMGSFVFPGAAGEITIPLTDAGIAYINSHTGENCHIMLVLSGTFSDSTSYSLGGMEVYSTFASPEHATESYRPQLVLYSEDSGAGAVPPSWGEITAATPSHRHRAGSTVVYRCYSAKDGAAESPTSGAVTITDSTGTVQVAAGVMTHTATGILDYPYKIDADAATGTWHVKATLTYGVGDTARYVIERQQFEVV